MLAEDRLYGLPDENNSFNGMLGLLQRGEADYSPAAYTMTDVRMEHFDFVDVILNSDTKMFIRNPKLSYNWMAYSKPLKRNTWIAVILLAILIALCLTLATHWPSQVHHLRRIHLSERPPSICTQNILN